MKGFTPAQSAQLGIEETLGRAWGALGAWGTLGAWGALGACRAWGV